MYIYARHFRSGEKVKWEWGNCIHNDLASAMRDEPQPLQDLHRDETGRWRLCCVVIPREEATSDDDRIPIFEISNRGTLLLDSPAYCSRRQLRWFVEKVRNLTTSVEPDSPLKTVECAVPPTQIICDVADQVQEDEQQTEGLVVCF